MELNLLIHTHEQIKIISCISLLRSDENNIPHKHREWLCIYESTLSLDNISLHASEDPFTLAKTKIQKPVFVVVPFTRTTRTHTYHVVTYHVTKNLNNTGEIGASVNLHWKKTLKNRRSFKKSHSGGGFFYSGFLQCSGVVA